MYEQGGQTIKTFSTQHILHVVLQKIDHFKQPVERENCVGQSRE